MMVDGVYLNWMLSVDLWAQISTNNNKNNCIFFLWCCLIFPQWNKNNYIVRCPNSTGFGPFSSGLPKPTKHICFNSTPKPPLISPKLQSRQSYKTNHLFPPLSVSPSGQAAATTSSHHPSLSSLSHPILPKFPHIPAPHAHAL